jgi:hypothetical protein
MSIKNKHYNKIIFLFSSLFFLLVLPIIVLGLNERNNYNINFESDYSAKADFITTYDYVSRDYTNVNNGYISNNMIVYSNSDFVRSGYGSGTPSSGLTGNFVRSGYGSGTPSSGLTGNFVRSGYGSGTPSSGLTGNFVRSGYVEIKSQSRLSSTKTYHTPVANSFSTSAKPNYQYHVRIYNINHQRYAFDSLN